MTTQYQKPIPHPSPETKPYWEACKNHELQLPYCKSCQAFFFYPRKFCPKCFAWDIEWRKCSGKGRLYTYSIQNRPQAPGFQNDEPYITAIVQLEEGPRLMTNLIDIEADPEKVKCDMPVEAVFEDISDEITLIKFRPTA